MIFENEFGEPVKTPIQQVVPDHFWMSAYSCLFNIVCCFADALFDESERSIESAILAGNTFFFPHIAVPAHRFGFSVYGILR